MVEKLLPPTGVDYEFLIDNVKNEYVIQSSDGEREIYNEAGQLIAMEYDAKEAGKKNKVRFEYEEVNGTNRLKAVYAASDDGTTSPNRLVFTYNDKGWVSEMIASASSDEKLESRTYRYSYDAWDRLVKVESFKGESSIEVYEYEYAESVSTVEETGEVAVRPDFPSVINRLVLPGHATDSPNEILGDFDGLIPSFVTEIDGTRTAYKNISTEESDDKVYQVTAVDKDENGVEAPLVYTFSKDGHLTKETSANKTTSYKWDDHRITKITNPDGSVESTDYDDRETADVDKTTELDGNVLVEKDATSITTYEYAENGDDILRIEDEFGLAEEVALNEDREEIINHEEPEERIGFTEYDSRGNVIREGVGLTPGVNLYTNGGFETSETVTPGTLVTGGRNGKALQLNSATFSREVNVKAGYPYNLGIDMKTTGTAKGSVTLTLLNSSNVSVGSYVIRPMGNLNEWTRRFVEFTAPDGAVKVRVTITSESGSTLFDEVQLDTAKQGHAVSASAFNHVEQSGFDGTNKWQLVKATASQTGYMSNTGLELQAGGSAKQTILVNQTIAKPFYVSVLAQKASKTDSLNVIGTYEDGTTVQKTASFNALNYTDGENASTWQRQTIQLTSESNKKLVKVDVTLQNGSTTNIIVDAVRASVGRVVSEVTYDKQGNHVLKDAGLSKVPMINTVDAFGNVLTIEQGSRIWQNKYDLLGRLIETKAENGTIIAYDYNEKGEVTQKAFGKVVNKDNVVIDPGAITKYAYSNGRISSVTRPNGQQYQYSNEIYTGNLIETTLPSGKRISNIYNEEGNVTEIKDGSILRFKYSYDKISGRLSNVQKDSDNSKEKKYIFETSTEGRGQLISLTDYHGLTQNWNYQNVNGIESELLLSTSLGNLNREFTYDAANRNDSVSVNVTDTNTKSFKWTFRHNEHGKLIQISMPGQSGETLLEYDENGNMTSWNALSNEKQIASEQYKYDSYGNLINLSKGNQIISYSYDAIDQLIEEKTFEGQTLNYSYDKRGNRTEINGQIVAKFDESNRMSEFMNQKIVYDIDGNRIDDGRLKYKWDGLGKLSEIEELNGSKKWQFIYDEHGRRIQKTGPSGTIYFHYDGDSNRLMAETDTSGKTIREYVYNVDGLLVGLKIDDSLYNYQRNHRGDVIAITDSTGEISAEYSYDAWGNPITKGIRDTKLVNQPIRYASYYYDEDLELYYLMARYYNPEQAVFLSLDPLIDSDESIEMANGYSYAVNNPIKFIDSSGLAVKPDGFGSGYNTGIGGGSSYGRAGVGGGSKPGNGTAKNKNSQIKQNQSKGKWFEDKILRELGLKKNTKKYHNAIPDAVKGNTFFEFKNANYVSKTKQFKNYEKSVNDGVRLVLYVRHWTVVSKPVRDLVKRNGGTIRRR
ncbi:hypothetical protein A6395_15225 [Exiguobacterium sp. SH31]|uniref:RHS repeat-associated core domain-containing protein n=1 Tax=Exiguobacterium sp. SH31 TaxID=1843183 RepID=UPI0008D8CDD8|nr:RHS repeat-associated core domain-containing protein [Exiguobacterium sp. SH31]OGX77825.1 hypothetical protein A6395_15225 [Exiguobacterium sp. SH31]